MSRLSLDFLAFNHVFSKGFSHFGREVQHNLISAFSRHQECIVLQIHVTDIHTNAL